MNGHIAIIDPDPVFARSMSQRLLHLIPRTQISFYSPEDLQGDPSLVLTEDVILYDETRTDQATLFRHTGASRPPFLIPLQAQGSENRRKMTGAELSRIVNEAAEGIPAKQAGFPLHDPSEISGLHKPPTEQYLARPGGHMRILLSFADRSDREKYAAGCTKAMLSSGLRIIRLDLMSGISMVNPFRRKNGEKETPDAVSSGISELLLQLESVKMQPDDLLHLLRRIADSPEENTSVLVVIEALPFRVLRQLCSFSHELHIIMPPQGQADEKLCEWELTDLFSSLPPNLLKFFSESRKAVI